MEILFLYQIHIVLYSNHIYFLREILFYLQDLYVDEAFRNQGLARQLIEHTYRFCEHDFDRVYWLTHESNTTAQRLYDRIASKTGFIQYKKALH